MNLFAKVGFVCSILLFLSGCQTQLDPYSRESQDRQLSSKLATPTPLPTPETPYTTPRATFTSTPTEQPTQTQAQTPQATSQATSSLAQELAPKIEEVIDQAGGRWHIIIKEVDGDDIYIREPDRRINIASVVKIPLAILFFKSLEQEKIPEEQLLEFLQTKGTGGRTFDQLLRAMLVKSEENATEILDEYIRTSLNVPAQMAAWDLSGLDLIARRYTAAGIADIFENFYLGDYINPMARDILLAYMNEYTPNDDLRIGSLATVIPTDYKIYNKRGSLLTPYVVADCAIIENPQGTDYIFVQFAYNSEDQTTYEALEKAQGDIALVFWDVLQDLP